MSGFGGRGGGGGFGGGFGGGRGGDRGGDSYGDENTVDMFVRAEECGRIIGRQGSKIRELQDQSGCRIKVSRDDEGDGTRRVELTGSDGAIDEAKRLIQQTLEDDRGYGGGRGGGGGGYGGGRDGGGRGGGGGFNDGGRDLPKEVMQIDSSFVGRIIGKGGSRVRDLQQETNCRINVSRDGHGSTTDVELIGSPQDIAAAKRAIEDITSQVY